ncbi:MAG: glycosyltransferase [Candidatus Adlerbacteria bacterium]|nr:glycosyltransferase [Candidatus Adlerbacteria bacterium]
MDIGAFGIYICLFIGLYFEVFLLISFLERRPEVKSAATPKRYPSVSILVPSFNEEKTIAGTLQSLLDLTYPKDKLEIVVINDGSKDKTAEIAARFAAEHPQIKLLNKENGGKYTALNVGIEHSSAELIGCLDADSFVAKDALVEAVKQFETDSSIMAITPAMKVYQPRKVLELMQSVEYMFGIFYKKMFDNLSAINVLPGPFSIYKSDVFRKIGGFKHAHNTEDMEITFRMHAHGLRIANAHTALVYTTVPNTVAALVKQRTRWSQGFLQNSRDYSYMFFNPRFGNFGMLVLPFGLIAFCAGLYTASYALYRAVSFVLTRALDMFATHIPPHLSTPHLQWFYINTSMMTFLVITVLGMTFVAIFLGQHITKSRLSITSFVSYFVLFGLIAPLWLARAAWGALRAQESAWR